MSKQPLRTQPDYMQGEVAVPRGTSAERVAARFSQASSHRVVSAGGLVLVGMPKRKLKEVVNHLIAPHTKGVFRDQYWLPVQQIWKAFEKNGIPFAITRSEYEYERGSNAPVRKVWLFEIDWINDRGQQDTLYGRVVAAGAGPVHDPLESYDVTAYAN